MISSKGWIPDSDRTETVSESDGVEATLPAIVLETECPLLGDQPSMGVMPLLYLVHRRRVIEHLDKP